MALAPRYPIFGGWSAKFTFGWSMPLEVVVARQAGSTYSISTLLGPAVTSLVVDELVVKVGSTASPFWQCLIRVAGSGNRVEVGYSFTRAGLDAIFWQCWCRRPRGEAGGPGGWGGRRLMQAVERCREEQDGCREAAAACTV